MIDWISTFDYQFLILLGNGLILILLLILLLNRAPSRTLNSDIENLNQLMLQNQRSNKDFQSYLDDKLSKAQHQLFATMLEDREKQLKSSAELSLRLEKRLAQSGSSIAQNIHEFKSQMIESFEQLKAVTAKLLSEGQQLQMANTVQFGEKLSESMNLHQTQTRTAIDTQINAGISRLREDLDRSIRQQTESVNVNLSQLTESTDNRLKAISGQVEKRLSDGFEKTNQTFGDVIKRLALIDDAQRKITELSTNVVSLQEILNDKRSRGAFGEIQLQSLISNTIPDAHYSMQQKLSNDKIADCVLILPEPTGKIAIDAKFPLESYKKMTDVALGTADRQEARKQFSRDIKKHINDIADKYILPPETSDGAVMFIPAESVFAEIHGQFPDLVEYSQRKKVWLVSPTTLMAILTTACAVIKDEQTRKQVHVIKEHLTALARDFSRFQGRMDSLSKHIGQVSKDVEQVHVSSRKITNQFERIERVEITQQKPQLPTPAVQAVVSESQE